MELARGLVSSCCRQQRAAQFVVHGPLEAVRSDCSLLPLSIIAQEVVFFSSESTLQLTEWEQSSCGRTHLHNNRTTTAWGSRVEVDSKPQHDCSRAVGLDCSKQSVYGSPNRHFEKTVIISKNIIFSMFTY